MTYAEEDDEQKEKEEINLLEKFVFQFVENLWSFYYSFPYSPNTIQQLY